MALPTDLQAPYQLDSGIPPTPPEETPISLDSQTPEAYLLDPKAIQDRAFKASYGLSETAAARPVGDYANAITFGQESALREEAAAKIDQKVISNRYNLMTKTLGNKQGPLTPDDLKAIDIASGYNFPYKYPTDPASVFETNYATKYTSELDKFSTQLGSDNFWNVARQVATNDTEAIRQYGSVLMAKHNYLVTKLQNYQALIDQQTSIGYALDFAKSFVSPYPEIKGRGNVPGASGFFLGSNLQSQSDILWAMPYENFTKTVDQIDNIAKDNPQQAQAVISALMGQSSSEKLFNNLNTVFVGADLASVFKIGASVFSKIRMKAELTKAAQDIIKANANPEATRVSILSSVGNLPAAAVEKEAIVLENRIKGSSAPTEQGLDSLQRFYRQDMANLANDEGTSITRRNILQQQMSVSQDALLTGLVSNLRPSRVPIENFSRQALNAIGEETVNRYAGLKNAIIHISDPYIEPITNRLFVTTHIGKNGGEYIDNLEEAAGIAKLHNMRVTFNPEQLKDLELRISALKDEIASGPSMHEDVHGLNYFNDLPKRLKILEDLKADVSRPGGFKVGQQGLKFYLERNLPVDHSTPLISGLIVNEGRATSVSPTSWTRFIPYFNKMRTAEDTMSAEHRAARKAALYPQSIVMGYMHETGKYINDLARGRIKYDPVTGEEVPWYKRGIPGLRQLTNRKYWQQFHDTLRHNQGPSPYDGQEGFFFQIPSHLDDFYLRNFGRVPGTAEHLAYQANKNWWDLDHIMREVAENRNRFELGAETHTVSYDAAGQKITSNSFDGIVQQKFPRNSDSYALIVGNTAEDTKIINLARMSTAKADEWDKIIKSDGYRVVRVYRPSDPNFADFVKGGDRHIEYVISKNIETRPLDWAKVPRTGGGHMVYDYNWFIKQGVVKSSLLSGIRIHRYDGDNTLWPVEFRALGQQAVNRLNVVKNFIRDGKIEEAKAAFRDSNLPITFEAFHKMFVPGRDSRGRFVQPKFNLTEDFMVVPRNKTTIEMQGENYMLNKYSRGDVSSKTPAGLFVDGTRQGDLSRRFQVEFTGERDARGLFTLDNTGTPERPIWNLKPAEKVDPIEIMNRSLGKIVRSTYMDDYKSYAVQAFLQEMKGKIKFTDSEIRSSPYYIFRTMNEKYFNDSVEFQDRQKYMANHFKINQLIGIPNTWDTALHSIAQNLADASYEKFGRSLIPQWLLHTSSDPTAWLRSFTFHAYLGMFSIPQLFVQMMTYVNIHAISPLYAPMGTMAAVLHGMSRFNKNPKILAALDEMATKVKIPGMAQWRPGEFTEAMNALDRSGFKNVAGEYGPLDTLNHTKVIKSAFGDFLGWGLQPFRLGERSTRIGAWYTAFKEFRDAHPTGELTNGDLQKILDRADFLYGNMSSASNSLLHTGILSLPTQFYAYNLRLAELFFSKRLAGGLGDTPAQRALARSRILAVNAAMFGVPMSLGVTGLPAGDYLRQMAIDYGYQPEKSGQIATMLMEGLASTILAHATGNYYNVPQRYATGGFTQMRNILSSDASFWQIIGGASASFVGNTIAGLDPLWQWGTQFMRRDTRAIPLKIEDFVDASKEFSIVNKGWGLWTALNTGKWINKSGNLVLDNVSARNAIFMTATGLSPLLQADARNFQVNLESQQNMQKFAMKEATKFMQRAYVAMANNDPQQAKDWSTKAMARLEAADMTDRQIATTLARSVKGKESIIERIAWERFIQHPPKGKEEKYREIYGYIHNQLKGNK